MQRIDDREVLSGAAMIRVERVEAGAGANFKNIKGGKYLNALSLFSGIGGLDLAAEMAGIKVIGFCEIEPFPIEVLTKRFPGVPIFEDVKTLTKESFMEAMKTEDKAVAFKGGDAHERARRDNSRETIDIIFGGFPQ